MDTASRLLYRRGHRSDRIAMVIVIAAILIASLAPAAVDVVAGLLQPGSEPLIAAPLRW